MSVIAIVQQTYAQVVAAYALAIQVVAQLITSGWYVVVRDAATVTQDIHDIVDDPTCGQAAQCSKLDALLGDVATLASDIAALGSPQQSGVAVTLPSTAPATFLDLTNGGTADAVWNYTDFRGLFTPLGIVYALYNLLNGQRQTWAMPAPSSNYFAISTDLLSRPVVTWPVLAPAGPDTILSTDADVGAWLARTQPSLTWVLLTGQQVWQATFSGPPNVYIQCTMSEAEFKWFRSINAGAQAVPLLPPVFPGFANVTYGAGQSMDAPNGSLGGPADGYRIVIDAVPSWAGTYSFGVTTSYRNVGAIAFVDDEGVPEFAQTLGLQTVHYLPKSMTHSVGAYYRLNIGYHCVAYPFVINS